MKSIRRSLKNERHQSPPSSGGSQQSTSSFGYAAQQAQGNHHVLGNGGPYAGGQAPIATLPPARQQGKMPPSKVIRAITSYRSDKGPPELSFEAGDFFHVMGDGQPRPGPSGSNVDELWYDAHNPLTRARGIVPASCFQVLGRNEKENKAAAAAGANGPISPPLQSRLPGQQAAQQGYPASSGSAPNATGPSPTPSPQGANFPHRSLNNTSQQQPKPRTKPSPLYGVVQHDFRAERADELDAKRGEPIIVIAQSNHEWFVAKPIGRLGGPGLIPVSFVAISDTTTGEWSTWYLHASGARTEQSVYCTGEALPAEKVKEMIASGMVPPVEEWKKATAEYKQASIPLGRFEFSSQPTSAPAGGAGPPFGQQQQASSSSASLPYAMQATSANNSSASLAHHSRRSQSALSSSNQSKGFNPNASQSSLQQAQQPSFDTHPRRSHEQQQQQPAYAPNSSSGPAPPQPHTSTRASNSQLQQSYPDNGPISPVDDRWQQPPQPGEPGSEEYFYDKFGLVTHATVESFHSEEDNYWFHLRVHFAMSGYSLILYRLYDDFFEFQLALKDEYTVEAGTALPPNAPPGAQPQRIIPRMPGPLPAEEVDEVVCAQRVVDLTVYLKGLCQLPDYMRGSSLFYEFFMARPGDVEVAVPDESARARWSAQKARDRNAQGPPRRPLDEEVVEYLDQMGSVTDAMGRTNLNTSQASQQPQANGKASLSNLPQLNTSTSSSSPFTPGYSMASSSGTSQHGRQTSESGTLPASANSQHFTSRMSDHSNGPMSAGSGIQFTSPWASRDPNIPAMPASSTSAASTAPAQQSTNPPPFVKIKIFHRNTDDLIAIRVPPSIRLDALLDKVRERLGGDVSHVRYRDEGERPVSAAQAASALTLPGGARLIELRSDDELDSWMKGTQRLVAYVD